MSTNMAASELSIDEIHKFFLKNGGVVANREVVKYFRHYLIDPATKEDGRLKFKRYVNKLATSRVEGDEKILMLKPKYHPNMDTEPIPPSYQVSPKYDPINSVGLPRTPFTSSPVRAPPPYRPPPPVTSPNTSYDNVSITSSNLSILEPSTPQPPPRKRSTDKLKADLNDSCSQHDLNATTEKENEVPENCDKQTVSVKERTQKFNRLASVEDEVTSPKQNQNKAQQQKKQKDKEKGVEEDDGVPVTSLEPKKCAAWYVAAAKGDYHELAKLASREPRLVKLKDPYTTVLHWGSKHGNVEIIKLFAGTYKADVNAKTNGGYVPLHIAAQFNRKDVFELLKNVYKADTSIRDFSGRKPEQYFQTNAPINAKRATKIKGRKNKYGDKDLGFLRIGSLNVRVKKTTEAFSSFLGVGTSMSSIDPIIEKVHKGWGSADNVGQDTAMPAPKGYISKRKSKRVSEQAGTHSNPGTPNQHQRHTMPTAAFQDSDSDSAAGFDAHWQN